VPGEVALEGGGHHVLERAPAHEQLLGEVGPQLDSRFPGKYATNDEAVLDRDGHLWVLGRADDVINVAAHRISTMEIEAVVTGHPDVVEAAVVGVPDDSKGTVPIAFVTLRTDAGDDAPE
jgi:acetyl-CoA synthetase